MNTADILRKLADIIADVENRQDNQPDVKIQNPGQLMPAEHDLEQAFDGHDLTAAGNEREPKDLFLPPLQQKQELLKKAVGVENVYDDGTDAEAMEQADHSDQEIDDQRQDLLNRIKKLSGIPVAAIQELSNDEVFDD